MHESESQVNVPDIRSNSVCFAVLRRALTNSGHGFVESDEWKWKCGIRSVDSNSISGVGQNKFSGSGLVDLDLWKWNRGIRMDLFDFFSIMFTKHLGV